MPLYDYQCDHCQTTFEVSASFQEKELGLKPVCPNCQNTETRQVLTVGLFVRSGNSNGGSVPSSFCGPSSGAGCCG
jgi:putative FmdB family regulatory protein